MNCVSYCVYFIAKKVPHRSQDTVCHRMANQSLALDHLSSMLSCEVYIHLHLVRADMHVAISLANVTCTH